MNADLHTGAVSFSDVVIQLLIRIIIDSCIAGRVRIRILHSGSAGAHGSVRPLLHGADVIEIMPHSSAQRTSLQEFIDLLSCRK